MPPRAAERLRGRAAFTAVLKSRHSVAGSRLLLRMRSNGTAVSRLGFIVPRALARRAVDRNYIRRVGREAFRHACSSGLDIVVRLREPFRGEQRHGLGRELVALFARLNSANRP